MKAKEIQDNINLAWTGKLGSRNHIVLGTILRALFMQCTR